MQATLVNRSHGSGRGAEEDASWNVVRAVAAGVSPLIVSIVGIDGCGKTSTFEGALEALAGERIVVGV